MLDVIVISPEVFFCYRLIDIHIYIYDFEVHYIGDTHVGIIIH